MPPKSKRKIQLEVARASKGSRIDESPTASDERDSDHDDSDDTNSFSDTSFDAAASLDKDAEKALVLHHVEEWVSVLPRDDLMP